MPNGLAAAELLIQLDLREAMWQAAHFTLALPGLLTSPRFGNSRGFLASLAS